MALTYNVQCRVDEREIAAEQIEYVCYTPASLPDQLDLRVVSTMISRWAVNTAAYLF